jgi:hypothetical protein
MNTSTMHQKSTMYAYIRTVEVAQCSAVVLLSHRDFISIETPLLIKDKECKGMSMTTIYLSPQLYELSMHRL